MKKNINEDIKIPESNNQNNLQSTNIPLEQLIYISSTKQYFTPSQIDQNIKECYMNLQQLRKSLRSSGSASSLGSLTSNTRPSSLVHKRNLSIGRTPRISKPFFNTKGSLLNHSSSLLI